MRPRRRHRAAAPATGGLATGAAAAAPRGRRAGPGRPCLPASSPGGTPAAKMSKVGRGSATPAAPDAPPGCRPPRTRTDRDRKSTRLNSSHSQISYAVFCLKKKKNPSDLIRRANVETQVTFNFRMLYFAEIQAPTVTLTSKAPRCNIQTEGDLDAGLVLMCR